jgi:hypothetical protein
MADEPLLATVTGEHFQPVRLHYRVLDQRGLLRAFKKLRCVDYDRTQNRWVWLYDHEARGLAFKQSYDQIPKNLHPIVIGSFFLREKDELFLDLRSYERATAAIEFFDRHIPRTVAQLTEAEVVNRLFPATASASVTPTSLFDRQSSTATAPEAAVRRVADRIAGVEGPEEKLRVASEHLEAEARQPLPEIQRLPIHFYEDGIQGFALALRMRQIVALQHWLGNTEYTMADVIRSVQTSM